MSGTGIFYVPKEIREAFGRNMRLIPNASAAVLFSEDTGYEDVLASLEIIAADIEHRLNLQEKRMGHDPRKKRVGRSRMISA